jgi:hypothetical protein
MRSVAARFRLALAPAFVAACGAPMPTQCLGAQPLDMASQMTIENWISAGAPPS